MSKQHTRHRRRRCAVVRALTVGGAAAALAAVLGAGQALAAVAPPDERVLERQVRIANQAAANQAGEEAKAQESSQQKATELPRRWIRPEPPMDTGPRLDADEQVAPAPPPPAPDDPGPGLTAPAILAALVLALAAVTTWRVRSHSRARPRPDATGLTGRLASRTDQPGGVAVPPGGPARRPRSQVAGVVERTGACYDLRCRG